MRTGGGSCGKIRFEFEGEPLFTHACHCIECQRRSGAAFCLSLFVAEHQLRLIDGTAGTCQLESATGKTKEISYCRDCGTMLYGRVLHNPRLYWLRPGTLDDTGWIRVQAHISSARIGTDPRSN